MSKAVRIFTVLSAIVVGIIGMVLGAQVAGAPLVTGKAAVWLGLASSTLGFIAHQLPQLFAPQPAVLELPPEKK